MPTEIVNVIIPTFNRAHCLRDAIDSALSQSYRDVEVIVVDDGSTDGTPELMATRYDTERRVRYVIQANAGVAAARNHGFRLATGAYVALLDSDDVWYPWKLELQLACLRAAPEAGMVWSDLEAVNQAGQVMHSRYLEVRYSGYRWFRSRDIFESSMPLRVVAPGLSSIVGEDRLYVGDIFSAMIMGSLVHTSTVLMRRERLERVGGFDESLTGSGEDYDFHLRTCREGLVAFADIASIRYRTGGADQLSGNRLAMASNALRTLSAALRDHGSRITLPRGMIRAKLAATHQWVGAEHLAVGSRRLAIRHLTRSLLYRPRQFRAMAFLGLALLPRSLAIRTRSTYGGLRRMARGGRKLTS